MDKFDGILKELQNFGFSKIEASVYLTLVRYAGLNGSQISKLLNYNRGSVYTAINSLYEKGAIFQIAGDTNVYSAEKPDVLINNLKEKYIKEYTKSAEILKNEFSQLEDTVGVEGNQWTVKGYNNFILKAKEILFSSEEEVFIETNNSLKIFKEELSYLKNRGVRVIIITTVDELIDGNIFVKKDNEVNENRISIVSDNEKAIIANGNPKGDFSGTFTENSFLIDLISNQIHYEIYLISVFDKYGKDWFKEIELKSKHEERIYEKLINNISDKSKKRKSFF